MDTEQAEREVLRWFILSVLYRFRPHGAGMATLLHALSRICVNHTSLDVEREAGYLEIRKLLRIDAMGRHMLTREGVDLVEYTIPCEPGIARPDEG